MVLAAHRGARRLALPTAPVCCYCTSGGGCESAGGGPGGGCVSLGAEVVRDRSACGDEVVVVDHREARDLYGAEVGGVAVARPCLVIGGAEAGADVESGLAALAAEGLDLRPRPTSGEQTTSALGEAAVRAAALGAPEAYAEDKKSWLFEIALLAMAWDHGSEGPRSPGASLQARDASADAVEKEYVKEFFAHRPSGHSLDKIRQTANFGPNQMASGAHSELARGAETYSAGRYHLVGLEDGAGR